MHKPGTGVLLRPKCKAVMNNFQGSVAFDATLLMDQNHSNRMSPNYSLNNLNNGFNNGFKMQLSMNNEIMKRKKIPLDRRSVTQPANNLLPRQTLKETEEIEKEALQNTLEGENFDSKKSSNMIKRNAMLVRMSKTY